MPRGDKGTVEFQRLLKIWKICELGVSPLVDKRRAAPNDLGDPIRAQRL